MSYSVKEIYLSHQGEGARAGRRSVFCRFTGCNLWSGLEKDRKEAKCYFCDTDFIGTDGPGGGKFRTANLLASAITEAWKHCKTEKPYVVFTGGEPLLQLDSALIREVHQHGFEIAVETNGTISAPQGIDWLTVSPKPNSTLVQKNGDELKLVYPHEVIPSKLEELDFKHFFLSPLDTDNLETKTQNIKNTINYCKNNPKWKITFQYHKFVDIS